MARLKLFLDTNIVIDLLADTQQQGEAKRTNSEAYQKFHAVNPPSTGIAIPVTKLAFSEQSHNMAFAISVVVANLFIGRFCFNFSDNPAEI